MPKYSDFELDLQETTSPEIDTVNSYSVGVSFCASCWQDCESRICTF